MKNNIMTKASVLAVAALLMLGGGALFTADPGSGGDFMISTALAQAPAGGGGGEERQGPPETLADYFRLAGITKWPLIAAAVWVTSLVIELLLRGRVKALCPPNVVSQLSSTLAVKDYVKAWQICIDNPSPLSRSMAPAIEKIPDGFEAASDAAMDYMNFQNNIFKIKCSYLNLNATVNTLLGLFGTITGMISAFNKMAYSGATGDPAKLAGSIGEALVCTWIGLGIAIFSLYLFYVFTNITKAAMSGMQRIVTNLLNEIDFASVTPDMEIITAEMKSRAAGGKGGAAEGAAPAKPAGRAAAAGKTEMAQCPHCQSQVQAGAAKCPNCNAELEWE